MIAWAKKCLRMRHEGQNATNGAARGRSAARCRTNHHRRPACPAPTSWRAGGGGGPVAYTPKWESLADALKRVTKLGATEEDAKVDISNAIADREIPVRVHAGKRSYQGGNVTVPQRLKPTDLDWVRSRPFQPWTIGPMLGQHYFWDSERLPIDFIELSTADLERLFGASSNALVDDLTATRGSKRPRIIEYLAEHYPDGVLGPGHVPRQQLRSNLIAWRKDLKPLDDDTLKRAIDEYNNSLNKPKRQ
jgi:hypothetical protein